MFEQPTFFWHLELSSKCVLKCPRCPRTEKKGQYKVTELTLPFVQQLVTPQLVAEGPVKRLLLCGGQGDPIYNSQFLEIVEYLKSSFPRLELAIVTNGSSKKREWWQRLGNLLNSYDAITFSIDGWDQGSNQQYRTNSDFPSILEGMGVMSRSSAIVRWSTIVFRFNQSKINEIKELAQNSGADLFEVSISNLFGSRHAHYIDGELGYDPLEPDRELFISKYGRYQRFTERLTDKVHLDDGCEEFEKRQMKKMLAEADQSYIAPLCVGGYRGLYVDAEGILYPCSWVSHPFGVRQSQLRDKKVKWNDSLWVQHKERFDLNQRSLSEILNDPLWNKLRMSWRDPDRAFVECESKCLAKNVSPQQVHRRPLDEAPGNSCG